MMVITTSLQLSHLLGIYKNHGCNKKSKSTMRINKSSLLSSNLSICPLQQDSWSVHVSKQIQWPGLSAQCKYNSFACHSILKPGHTFDIACLKNAAVTLTRPCNAFQGSALVHKLIPAIGIVFFTVYGLGPLTRLSRNIFLHKTDNSWKKSSSYYVISSYLQPMLLWTGATLICRALDPVVLPTEASQIVKQRLLNFLRSLSTVLAFAFCLSSLVQQAQKFFIETNEATDTRNMGFQFAGKAIYTAVWVAAVSLFMELLGFSAQKWLTAGGLGTVLLTLAGREIFTNFLSSVMIHATRPFVMNEWIQTKIEGYEVSGTVEHVGWWSPTIIRGEDREAVHIPNHKFTVNVVRNLTQKSHWRIKTHLAISHLDVNKINNIVADMRKVLAKNPQVEQQKLHRRVFLDNINPENQALLILVSCFVKTSHFEEYLCVKEAILLDLLRVIRHHRARLATPIRTVQKIFSDTDLESIPFEPVVTRAAPTNRPLLLIEPSYKINGEERAKRQTRPIYTNGEQDGKSAVQPAPDNKIDIKGGTTHKSDSKAKEMQSSMANEIPRSEAKAEEMQNPNTKEDHKIAGTCIQNAIPSDKTMTKSSEFVSNANSKFEVVSGSESKAQNSDSSNQVAKKQAKKAGQENAWQVENSSASLPESGNEIPGSFSSPSQSKQDNKRSPVAQPTASKSTLEENIVLGVALDGSKRTLPIDEEMVPPLPSTEIKELTKYPGGSGPSASEEDGKNGQA